MSQRVVTTPGPYIDSHRPDLAVITRFDGTTSVLMAPKIFNDTIMAFSAHASNEQVMVPLPQVQSITVKTLNKPRTIGLFAVGFATVVGVASSISGHGPPPNPSCNGKQPVNQTVSCRAHPHIDVPAAKVVHGLAQGVRALFD